MNSLISRKILLISCFTVILAMFHLQAEAVDNDIFDETTLEKLNETTLDVLLIGTAPGGIERGFAIILDITTNTQRIYRVGDYIENAEIKFVSRKHVVLGVGGENQVLSFADPRKIEGVPADEVLDEYVFEPTETIFVTKPEVFIQRGKPSSDNPNEKPKIRRILFKAKQKKPESD